MVGGGIFVVFHSVRPHLEYQKQNLGPVHISFPQGSSEFALPVWQKFPKDYDSGARTVQAIQDGISLKLLTFMCIKKIRIKVKYCLLSLTYPELNTSLLPGSSNSFSSGFLINSSSSTCFPYTPRTSCSDTPRASSSTAPFYPP